MRFPLRHAAACAALLACTAAHSAGGHHAVDDAAILEEGKCEVETWFSRAADRERLLHLGTGCRVGPVELGVAGEYSRLAGTSQTAWGLQAKWATEVREGLSVGLSVGPAWQAHVRPRYQGFTLAGLLTWQAAETVAVHLNVGRDFVRRGDDLNRSGISLEWAPREGWSVVAERYAAEDSQFFRAGLRHNVNDKLTVDLSRAQRLSGPSPSNWTLGVTWLFDR